MGSRRRRFQETGSANGFAATKRGIDGISISNWTAGAVRNVLTRVDRLERLVHQLLTRSEVPPEEWFHLLAKAAAGRDGETPDSGEGATRGTEKSSANRRQETGDGEGVTRGTEKSSANRRPETEDGEGVTRGTGKSIANCRPNKTDGEGVSRGTGHGSTHSRQTHGQHERRAPESATPEPSTRWMGEFAGRVAGLEDQVRHTAALLTEVLRYGAVSEHAQVQKAAAGPLTPSSGAGLDEGSVVPRCTAAPVAHSPETPSSAPGLGEGNRPSTPRSASADFHTVSERCNAIDSRLGALETNLAFPPELALVLSQLPQLLATTASTQQQLMQDSRQHTEAIMSLRSRTPDDASVERLLGMIETVVRRVKDFEGTLGLHHKELTDIRASLTSLPEFQELRSLIASVAAVSTDLYDGLRRELHELVGRLHEISDH